MSKSILISIRPEWCEKIASGQKTIEVRKTRPKIETPFKCYIYESHGDKEYYKTFHEKTIGKAIGEFVCDGILSHCESSNADLVEQQGCIRREKLLEYSQGRELYGWHISDLVIYDKPKELSEFMKPCIKEHYCDTCAAFDPMQDYCMKTVTMPPQSWCYVEEKT